MVNIGDVAMKTSTFSILVAAIKAAKGVDTFKGNTHSAFLYLVMTRLLNFKQAQ
ncbi:hypothetical protein [Nostoc sp. LPT]|uniref:hypothetical protein n=1 Tax=Nostoc sp. LPT TaxID=2815387 RepID=UPI001DD94DB9|nr:hypothetical protein [Nostoc sp. LPT]MBN4006663.1 hypothetical protein [Nostoc sp. LPT]